MVCFGQSAFATSPEGGRPSSGGKRRLIRGGGLVTRISNIYEPQIPVVGDDIPCPAARDVVVSHVRALRPLETVTPRSSADRKDIRLSCSDSEVSDDDVLSVGAVQPLETADPLGGAGLEDDRQPYSNHVSLDWWIDLDSHGMVIWECQLNGEDRVLAGA